MLASIRGGDRNRSMVLVSGEDKDEVDLIVLTKLPAEVEVGRCRVGKIAVSTSSSASS